MIDYILSGGYAMWAVLLCALVMTVMAVRGWRPERRADAADTVLFWALAALAIGVIGTLIGLSQMAAALSRVSDASPSLVWGGARLALSTSIVGMLAFLAGLGFWSLLKGKARRRA